MGPHLRRFTIYIPMEIIFDPSTISFTNVGNCKDDRFIPSKSTRYRRWLRTLNQKN